MNSELRSINCYELVGYFWATARTLVQKSRVAMTSFVGPPQSKILATPMRLPAAYCVDGVIMLKILTVGKSSYVQE